MLFLPLLLLLAVALANVEKSVFVAPAALGLPHELPPLSRLSPAKKHITTRLPVAFASTDAPRGRASWYLLDGLRGGQRYEVRVCWPATQPTAFWLDTYPIATVFETPELISALDSYSEAHRPDIASEEQPAAPPSSLLFLQVQAAADFYSTNETLMKAPPDVLIDIILDPYLLNILPRSLAPTAAYITTLAVAAWLLSSFVCRWHSPSMSTSADFPSGNSLSGLATEILLQIIDCMQPDCFINFAFAAYPLLQSRCIVPLMTWALYAPLSRGISGGLATTAWPLPTELTLEILKYLSPKSIMAFVLTHHSVLPQAMLPQLTPETLKQLRKAWAQVELAGAPVVDPSATGVTSTNADANSPS